MNTTYEMNSKNTNYFTINFFTREIIGVKSNFNRAGKGFGAEYEELTAKMAAHPDFKLTIKVPEKKSNKPKKTYKGMDYAFMEAYIEIQENSEKLMQEYNAFKKAADEAQMKVYPATKRWFLDMFSKNAEFDMSKAMEEIQNYQYAAVSKQASSK